MIGSDAQSSLDGIRRMREHSAREYVRHLFSWPYTLATAVGVFLAFASYDLSGTWGGVVFWVGLLTTAAVPAVLRRRAPVHRRPGGAEVMWSVAIGLAMIVLYVVVQILAVLATLRLGMPAPHTVAAAAMAVFVLATAGLSRRVCTAFVLRSMAARERRGA